MYGKVLAAGLAIATFLNGAEAHTYLSYPPPRAKTIDGHRFKYEPQSDGTFNGECADGGRVGNIVATYYEGDVITVTAHHTAHHNGQYQLRFCAIPTGGNSCLQATLATPVTPSDGSVLPNSQWGNSNGFQDAQFILPAGLTCDHCVMQYWYKNNNGINEHFKSCHDIRILPRDGSPPTTEAPAPTSSSTSTTSSSVPSPPPSTGSDGCACKAVPGSGVSDIWCSPINGANMCIPDYTGYCERVCGSGPNAPVTATTTVVAPTSTVFVTKTVAECRPAGAAITVTTTVTLTECW